MHAFIDRVRRPDLEKLSHSMWELLFSAVKYNGRAPFEIAKLSTRRALEGRGYMKGWAITDAGREVCAVTWCHPGEVPGPPAPDGFRRDPWGKLRTDEEMFFPIEAGCNFCRGNGVFYAHELNPPLPPARGPVLSCVRCRGRGYLFLPLGT